MSDHMTLAEAIRDEAAQREPSPVRRGSCRFVLDDGERCLNGWQLDEHEYSTPKGWICPTQTQRREIA